MIETASVIVLVDHVLSRLFDLKKSLGGRYAVHTASSPLQALRLIEELPRVDVLIVHQDLNGMKGTDFLRMVHESYLRPGKEDLIRMVIAPCGNADEISYSPFYGSIDSCLTKPFDADAVLTEVSRLVARRSKEKRSSLRVPLPDEKNVVVEVGKTGGARVGNISEKGMFLKTEALLPEGKTMPFLLSLSSSEKYLINGRIVRLDKDRGGVGVEFQLLDEQSRKAIFHFLSDYVSLGDLTELKERYPFLRIEDMIAFRDKGKIEALFKTARRTGVEITALSPHMRVPVALDLRDAVPDGVCVLKGKELDVKFKTSDPVFLSFQADCATYNFETTVRLISPGGEFIECFYPRVMFYSEKRSLKRESPENALTLEIALPPPFQTAIRGPITDISEGGVSFISEESELALLAGTPLESIRILDSERMMREERGEVRNVVRVEGGPAGRFRYGIQFGIGRLNIQSPRVPQSEPSHPADSLPDKARAGSRIRTAADLSELPRQPLDIIRLENRNGEEIVGLLNSSFPLDDQPVPVVVIPPAFGKTKESLFGLALTLIENFHVLGKPLAVIRFDGIRCKGESQKDAEASVPPYELVNANFSQGAEDIRAVLDWIRINSRLKASSIVLVTFSLSALDARIVLRDEVYRRRIGAWISCMGTPEFRHLMIRVNCGLDFLEHYQLGIKLGVMPVLGNLVNVDSYVADGVANAVATLDQAREDMRHLDIPVTWIYGEHDHWVKAEFIRDIMSVEAAAPREVIPVPIGHNARTSEEALRLFGTITSLVHRFFHGEMIQPLLPDKKDMNFMRRAEKDRIPQRNLENRKDYWERYLVGEENLLGFDVMTLSDDYRQLLQDQFLALDIESEDHLLDLGGGTGNFIKHLLERNHPLPAHMTIADLVPEAMKKAVQKLASQFRVLQEPGKFDLMCLDLELNRFLPVRRFLDGEIGRFQDLADRIENLPLASAQRIDDAYSPGLHRILRGEAISADLDGWLRSRFELAEYRIIVDFNQAVRYVRGLNGEKPSFCKIVFPGNRDASLHLPVKPGWYNKILMSLVLSYVFNPVETLLELRRIIRSGGRLVLSSMRPDADASGPFTRLMEKIEAMPAEDLPPAWPKQFLLKSLRSFLNEAQALVDLEEAGTFDFFDPEKLKGLLEEAGWDVVRTIPTFGDPPQGYIVAAQVRSTNGS